MLLLTTLLVLASSVSAQRSISLQSFYPSNPTPYTAADDLTLCSEETNDNELFEITINLYNKDTQLPISSSVDSSNEGTSEVYIYQASPQHKQYKFEDTPPASASCRKTIKLSPTSSQIKFKTLPPKLGLLQGLSPFPAMDAMLGKVLGFNSLGVTSVVANIAGFDTISFEFCFKEASDVDGGGRRVSDYFIDSDGGDDKIGDHCIVYNEQQCDGGDEGECKQRSSLGSKSIDVYLTPEATTTLSATTQSPTKQSIPVSNKLYNHLCKNTPQTPPSLFEFDQPITYDSIMEWVWYLIGYLFGGGMLTSFFVDSLYVCNGDIFEYFDL